MNTILSGCFVGPTLGENEGPILYCLDSDESSMICADNCLSEHAKMADAEYVRNNSAFILAVLATTNEDDKYIIDAEFEKNPSLYLWQLLIYDRLGLTPSKNVYFVPVKNFASFAKKIVQQDGIKIVSTIGYSYLLNKYFSVESLLNISRKLNAKTSLLELSQKYKFSIPKSVVVELSELTMSKLEVFGFPAKAVYLKMDGLGGGYNVRKITSKFELESFINAHQGENVKVLIQQEIPADFIETEHIFAIYPSRVEHLYSAVQITKNSSWYGNVFLRDSSFTLAQSVALENATRALQEEGYANKNGLLVGFDSLANEDEMYIVEINARWLGSLPVERLLRRLNLLGKSNIFSSFDYVEANDFTKYMEFCERYLYDDRVELGQNDFAIIPLSFSAYSSESNRVVYYVVIGSISVFAKRVLEVFGLVSFSMLSNSLDYMRQVLRLPGL